jgi:hypothetical protein
MLGAVAFPDAFVAAAAPGSPFCLHDQRFERNAKVEM